jgi:hypothetical protein
MMRESLGKDSSMLYRESQSDQSLTQGTHDVYRRKVLELRVFFRKEIVQSF